MTTVPIPETPWATQIQRRPTAALAQVLAAIVEGLRADYQSSHATQEAYDHLAKRICDGIELGVRAGDFEPFGVPRDYGFNSGGVPFGKVHVENVMTAAGERTRVWFDFAGTPLEAHTEPAT